MSRLLVYLSAVLLTNLVTIDALQVEATAKAQLRDVTAQVRVDRLQARVDLLDAWLDLLELRCEGAHDRLMAHLRWYVMRRSGEEELEQLGLWYPPGKATP